MSNILLSFCIPTYNRPERIESIIKQIIPFQSEEIEILISDDNPSFEKTQEVVKKFNDPRIKYKRNKKNLGAELNMIKTIKKAIGTFVFFLNDEDDIEMETIPWILKTIKKNNNLTQLCGILGDKRPNQNKFYYKFEDKLLNRGYESLRELLFYNMHGSSIVLKKKALDLNESLNYLGTLTLPGILVGQACIAGDTLCTSKIFAYVGEIQYESCQPRVICRSLNALKVIKSEIQILYDITKEINNAKKLRKLFLDRAEKKIYIYLSDTFSKSIKSFLEGISIVISIKRISIKPTFWVKELIEILFRSCIRILKISHNKIFNYFIHNVAKLLDVGRPNCNYNKYFKNRIKKGNKR